MQALRDVRRAITSSLVAPDPLVHELAGAAAAAGLIPDASAWAPGSAGWAKAWAAITKVRGDSE